jgi:hypothetical protein
MKLRALAALVLAAALSLTAAPARADFFDPPVNDPGGGSALDFTWTLPQPGVATEVPTPPGCSGRNYSYHVWNLIHPMEVYGMDSCAMNLTVLYRRSGGTFAQFMAALTTARWPQVGVPASITIFFSGSDALAICQAPGTGVELTVSNLNGSVIGCRAQ